jgi:hypothetical protein
MAQGGSKDFKDMLILRLISGAFEAVAKPGFSALLWPKNGRFLTKK